jgi:nucleotide-binding universal stress UspA family protein
MIVLKRILVATDFSEPSIKALAYGRDLARAYDATLHILHVTGDALAQGAELGFVVADLQASVDRAARAELDKLVSAADAHNLRIVRTIKSSRNTATAIVDFARDEGMDLIIVGTQGRGAISHLFMGSVAERVVRSAPCPVLAVRAYEREFIAPDPTTAA